MLPLSSVTKPSVGSTVSTYELAALTAFVHDPSLQVFEASTVKDFGRAREAPRHALIHFEGDDPEDGSILRYTLVTRALRQARLTVGEPKFQRPFTRA